VTSDFVHGMKEKRYSRYMGFNCLLGVKIIYFINRTDLFKISNLVVGGEAIVTDLYSSLEG
jgi:hypothetical protein